jgi:N-acetylglucosaminyl-diphospho-decaprenol L-rhamnosyltransferase
VPSNSTLLIIVHFGDPRLTNRSLRSVLEASRVPDRIVVVDNGPGEALSPIATEARVEYVRPTTNLGFAGGVNFGLQRYPLSSLRYVWLLNNDAMAERNTLEELERVAAAHGRGMVSSLVLDETTGRPWFTRARFYPLLLRARHMTKTRQQTSSGWLGVDYLPGCSLLIDTSLLQTLHGMDASYFLYGEDIDLSLRATRLGATLSVAEKSIVWHRPSSSLSFAEGERRRAETSVRVVASWKPAILPAAIPLAIAVDLILWGARRRPDVVARRLSGYRAGLISALLGRSVSQP